VDQDEAEEPDEHEEVQRRAVWMLNVLLIRLNRIESAGDMPRPVIRASGAATKTVTK
jgi:hypothetical protein